MTTLDVFVTRKVISRLIRGQDYRIEILSMINAEFLEYAINFFKRIVEAKLRNEEVTVDWYKKEFLNPDLPLDDLIIHSGLNKKSVSNMYNSARRKIVLDATNKHYEQLKELIEVLIENAQDINFNLHITFRGVSVELNINESLIVINTLAVKRAQIRGGLWSTAGKQVERPLLTTLCKLFSVPEANYSGIKGVTGTHQREVDFYLFDNHRNQHQCEVKLMGKGNPESADAVIARDTQVFVADKLSDLNKQQLDNLGIQWIELRAADGYRRFMFVLQSLGIPHQDFRGDLDTRLTEIFDEIFNT